MTTTFAARAADLLRAVGNNTPPVCWLEVRNIALVHGTGQAALAALEKLAAPRFEWKYSQAGARFDRTITDEQIAEASQWMLSMAARLRDDPLFAKRQDEAADAWLNYSPRPAPTEQRAAYLEHAHQAGHSRRSRGW